jgi:type I restriction enzyme M protein
MLKEMRDASGKSGEFYTPRPLIRLIIDRLAPKLGDRILDPACGTCGFLAEAYERLKPEAKTPAARLKLQQNLIGIEKKAMPYLLGVVNLLLHGVDQPSLDERNTLASPIRQIKDSDRVEVIATNPPFGGEEEEGILNNFPDGMKTKETAVLFFQHVMAKIKRGEGRCGIVLPNGFLFGEGVATDVKKQLLQRFKLHTVIRLPEGVFQPYTKINTNVLFFDSGDPDSTEWGTKEIWFYEHPLPEGRSSYSKTKPLEYSEFLPLLEWWDNRQENTRAWKVPLQDVIDNNFDLDIKNPNAEKTPESFPPEDLVTSISTKSKRTDILVTSILQEMPLLAKFELNWVPIGSFASLVKRPAVIEPGSVVKSLGVKWWGKGACIAEIKLAEQLQADRFLVRGNDLIYNDMWARHGSVAIVPVELDGSYASAHFPTWELNQEVVYPPFLAWCFKAPWFWAECEEKSRGSTGRNAIRKDPFRSIKIPLPKTIDDQKQIVTILNEMQLAMQEIEAMQVRLAKETDALLPSVLDNVLVVTDEADAHEYGS